MIYLTGDIHGSIYRLNQFNEMMQAQCKTLSKGDFVIVLGDFGLIWYDRLRNAEKYETAELKLDILNGLPFTTLFIEGNHENHIRLGAYPVSEWHGGKVSLIRDSVIHLKRGQVFDIAGKKFFTMGGADSIDKAYRTEGISWWQEENISADDLDEAYRNLAQVSNNVDYVLTHAAPVKIAKKLVEIQNYRYEEDINEIHLRDLDLSIACSKWFCGHYHVNCNFGKYTCLYQKIVSLDGTEEYNL